MNYSASQRGCVAHCYSNLSERDSIPNLRDPGSVHWCEPRNLWSELFRCYGTETPKCRTKAYRHFLGQGQGYSVKNLWFFTRFYVLDVTWMRVFRAKCASFPLGDSTRNVTSAMTCVGRLRSMRSFLLCNLTQDKCPVSSSCREANVRLDSSPQSIVREKGWQNDAHVSLRQMSMTWVVNPGGGAKVE